MGRRTFELIGKPLPGRFNIVLTRNPEYNAPGCHIAGTYQEGLSLAADYLASTGGDEAIIIGGSKVYAEAIHHWDRLYLTVVEGQFNGNAYFPVRELLRQPWRQVCEPEAHPPDEKNRFSHTFHIIERAWDSPQQGMDTLSVSGTDSEKTLEELDLTAVLRPSS